MLYQLSYTRRVRPSYPRYPVVVRPPIALAAVVVAAAIAASATPAGGRADATVFSGLGAWLDIYDTDLYRPADVQAAALAAHGVRLVWIETSNDRSVVDVVAAPELGAIVDALHAHGIRVAAWTLPGHTNLGADLRRMRAMLVFRTPTGGAFDAVALDIESLREKNVKRRTGRMLALLRTLRREAGATPVAAIVYPHRTLERHPTWWPGFPWAAVAAQADVIVPMLYTGSAFRGYEATYGYVARSLLRLRNDVGASMPIHAVGGVANQLSDEELGAFVEAVADVGGSTGWSLYDLRTTSPADWEALARLSG